MAKDHFVPRFYLRQFAINESELIAVSSISPYRFFGPKGIGGQCQEDNFEEGDRALGEALKASENDLAPVLVRVAKKQDYDERELVALKWLAVTLLLRTRKAANVYKVFPTRICYDVIKNAMDKGNLPPPAGGKWTEELIGWKGVPSFLMRNAIPCSMQMQTLACKLLRTPHGDSFITSDNPVVMLNQFCASADPFGSFVGFGRSGFQILMPISPNLCLLFYDAKIYKVGSRRYRLIELSKADVEIVNALQIQSSEDRLYFHDLKLESTIQCLITRHAKLRIPVQNFMRGISGRNKDEEFLHIRAPSATLPTIWNFCRMRRRINYKPGDRRDPAWSAMIKELMKDIDQNPNAGDISTRLESILADPTRLRNIRNC